MIVVAGSDLVGKYWIVIGLIGSWYVVVGRAGPMVEEVLGWWYGRIGVLKFEGGCFVVMGGCRSPRAVTDGYLVPKGS